MSRLMIEKFFPVNLAKAETYWLGNFLYEVFFPPHVANLCPEVIMDVAGFSIRQPMLAISATVGIFIGMKGGLDLLWWGKTESINRTESQSGLLRRRTRLWSIAFVTFGIMNVSALPLHCFLPAPFTTYPKESPIWWSVDTYMTGVSSVCLFMAALQYTAVSGSSSESSRIKPSAYQFRSQQLGLFLHVVGAVCLICFWTVPEILPIGLEEWYLLPPLLAGGPVTRFVVWQNGIEYRPLGPLTFIVGVVVAMWCIAFDRPMCYYTSTTLFLDAFTAPTGVFFACDLCFLGLLWTIQSTNTSHQSIIISGRTTKLD